MGSGPSQAGVHFHLPRVYSSAWGTHRLPRCFAQLWRCAVGQSPEDLSQPVGTALVFVAYLTEMWLLKYDKCIYLNSNMTLYIPVSFCGLKHYTRNRTRTSWMTFQDLNSASWYSLPNFPFILTEIALCTALLWQGKVKPSVVCSIRLHLQWGRYIPQTHRTLCSTKILLHIWSVYLLHPHSRYWHKCWPKGG